MPCAFARNENENKTRVKYNAQLTELRSPTAAFARGLVRMVVIITGPLPCDGTAGGCLLFFGAGGGGRLIFNLPTAPSDNAGEIGACGDGED